MSLPVALLLCLALAGGIVLIGAAVPRPRRPGLAARLEPYLRGLAPRRSRLLDAEELPLTPFPTVERLLRPLVQEGSRIIERAVGGSATVARRLREAGRDERVARFRAEQVLWGLLGFLAAILVSVVLPLATGRQLAALPLLGASSFGVLAGVLARDWWLTQQVERRQARMLAEFPTLAELLCLAVTAGEAPRAALERVVRRSRGEMSRELALVLADLRVGVSFATALRRLAVRVPVAQVVSFVNGLVVAVERGTPLAELLHAQADEVREQRKRQLIEVGGRKEVYMLVPVVFLILPVVVLFALYPGVVALGAFTGG